MMKIDYCVFNPTNNITVLVETPVMPEQYSIIAENIMKIEPTAQQVGFVNDHSLYMAGGEFCGNASISAAALCYMRNGITVGKDREIYYREP